VWVAVSQHHLKPQLITFISNSLKPFLKGSKACNLHSTPVGTIFLWLSLVIQLCQESCTVVAKERGEEKSRKEGEKAFSSCHLSCEK
jgi:hypothetical protein